jgi:predicted SAM-dependent methyltransferase
MEDIIKETMHYGRPSGRGLKLHLGCGDYWRDGSINMDHAVLGGTDMVWDLRQKLPFQDESVERIESYEFVEHFTKAELDSMLKDWHRVLIKGGYVISVVPDIEELMNQGLINQIYGIEQDHKWGYTIDSLKKLFEDYGFNDVSVEKREFPHRPGEPKLMMLCTK